MTPFKCEHCGEYFKTKKTLDQHVQMKYIQKRWQCQVEGCQQAPISHRTRKKDVPRHQRQHHDEKDKPPAALNYRAVPPMRPDSQSVYYPDYMDVPEEDRLNPSQSWYSRIDFYASDNEHPDPEHAFHGIPG